jgi:hypothetical protein
MSTNKTGRGGLACKQIPQRPKLAHATLGLRAAEPGHFIVTQTRLKAEGDSIEAEVCVF